MLAFSVEERASFSHQKNDSNNNKLNQSRTNRVRTNSGGCIVCPFALARKFLFLRDEHLVSIDGVLGVLKRARDDASLFASLVCTDADRIRTTGGSPLLETVEPERYVMA